MSENHNEQIQVYAKFQLEINLQLIYYINYYNGKSRSRQFLVSNLNKCHHNTKKLKAFNTDQLDQFQISGSLWNLL